MARLTLLVAVLSSLLLSAPAQAGILEFFFPSLKEQGPDPSKTLVAPFADNAPTGNNAASQQNDAPTKGLPENAIPLDFPHRTPEQVGEWAVMAASEAMTFDKPEYEDLLRASLQHFDEGGKKQFLSFLQQTTILDIIKTGKYSIRTFAQEHPLLLNEGAVNGRYRWLYEIPMMISYMDRNITDYKKKAAPVNQSITLTVQIGRTPDLEPGHDLAIEQWAVKARKEDKKPDTPAP